MEAGVGAVRSPCVLRTPEQRRDYRRSLHKASGNSPAWKDAYRKRCMDRLRDNRQRFLSRLRSLDTQTPSAHPPSAKEGSEVTSAVQTVMMEEWEGLRREVWGQETESGYLEHVLGVMDELREELIHEEQAILTQYEHEKRFDEEALCAAINSLTTDDIICPICQKNVLHQNHHIIFCACGLQIDTAQDGVTLDYVRAQLEECSSQHSSSCLGQPFFSLETTLGMQNIIMNCPICEFMFIII